MKSRVSQRQMALYKFIRLAGDLLPPSLYISYASMLCGLANGKRAAHQAFTLLKQNSSGGQSNLISWEHFFSSLHRYFNSLRQESLPVPDTIYRHKPLTKGITPQEVQGLQVVLKLMRIILHHDPIARISLAENPTWIPLVVMIGLLGRFKFRFVLFRSSWSVLKSINYHSRLCCTIEPKRRNHGSSSSIRTVA